MQNDLLKLVGEALSSRALQKTSDFLGEPQEAVVQAFNLATASVLGALYSDIPQLTETEWAKNIINGLHDGSMLSNLDEVLVGGAATSGVLDSGSKFINRLLGKRQDKLVQHIVDQCKIGRGSASKILSFSGPIVLNSIGKAFSDEPQNAKALSNLLKNQSPGLSKALSPQLIAILDLEDEIKPEIKTVKPVEPKETIKSASAKIQAKPRYATNQIQKSNKWFFWIALGALSLISILVFKLCTSSTTENQTEPTVDIEDHQVEDGNSNAAMMESDETPITSSHIEAYIENSESGSSYFELESLEFDADSGQLSVESAREMEELAEVLKSSPSVQAEIYAFVFEYEEADANQALSELKANLLLQKMSHLGVKSSQMKAIGMGGQLVDDIPNMEYSNSVYLKIIKN